jgi:hypothetical protein
MSRRYYYRLAILDAKGYTTDQFWILNFNHGDQFHPQPSAVVNSNRAGLKLIMEEARDKQQLTIKKNTSGSTVRFLNAHYKKLKFRALQFMVYKYHYRTKGLWSEVVEEYWSLEEIYKMPDVHVTAINPRVKEQDYGTVDNIVLGLSGGMTFIGSSDSGAKSVIVPVY